MTIPIVTIAVEGDLDVAVARRLLTLAGFPIGPVYGKRGKDRLDKGLKGYNNAARHAPWLVLRDLDHDAECAPEIVRSLMPEPSMHMCFRVAVRQVEAWLLADRARMADLFQLPLEVIPQSPEMLDDAKAAIVQLARRSRNRRLREDIAPETSMSAKVGPGYTARMIEFATNVWRPQIAQLASPSLASCLRSVERWRKTI